MSERFTIEAGRWYGWQMMPGYVSSLDLYEPYFSPALIDRVNPRATGKSILSIGLSYVIYPSGAGPTGGNLKILKRDRSWLVADMIDYTDVERSVLISIMSYEWIEACLSNTYSHLPPNSHESVTDYLNRVTGQRGR